MKFFFFFFFVFRAPKNLLPNFANFFYEFHYLAKLGKRVFGTEKPKKKSFVKKCKVLFSIEKVSSKNAKVSKSPRGLVGPSG